MSVNQGNQSNRNIFAHFHILVLVFATLHLGCGAGCSCAKQKHGVERVDTGAKSSTDSKKKGSGSQKKAPFDLVDIGRKYEFGKYDAAAKKLKSHLKESDRTRYLGALIADAMKDYEQVVALLRPLLEEEVSFSHSELKLQSGLLFISASAHLKRYDKAIEVAKNMLDTLTLSKVEQRGILEKMGDFQMETKQFLDAAVSYEEARKWCGPTKREQLAVKLAHSLLNANQKEQAAGLLVPLASSGKRKKIISDAYDLLQQHDLVPNWSTDEQLARIDALIAVKSWNDAQVGIEQLAKTATGALAKELRWQKANLLFARRNHYKEAVAALALVVKDGPPHGDRAAFLSARALSRLDRDEEAILAFLKYAQKTKEKGRAALARFYAARLEFYLGKHADALNNFQQLVGNGKKKTRVNLDGGTRRDAHFLAGMSAYLHKKYDTAKDHFDAASVGSSSSVAILRNTYWGAAAVFATDKQKGKHAFERICKKDPTNWYSLFAAVRIKKGDLSSELCSVFLPADKAKNGKPYQSILAQEQVNEEEFPIHLSQLSSKATLYASMGLFHPAAEALNEAEKSRKVKASKKDWILQYMKLDAPQYAIRNASIGLDWEKRDEEAWLSRTAYPIPYWELVQEETQRHSLPSFLIYSIARKESLFDPFAVSSVGAMGMMQMMPATYETNRQRAGLPKLKAGKLPDPSESIKAGGFELAHLLKKFNGNLPLAIMAYNGGSKAVERWLDRSGEFATDVFVEKAGFAQTRNYVRRVYQNLVRYRQLYNAPLPMLPRDVKIESAK